MVGRQPELLPPAATYVDSFDPFCLELGLTFSPQPQTGAPGVEKNKSTGKRQITTDKSAKRIPKDEQTAGCFDRCQKMNSLVGLFFLVRVSVIWLRFSSLFSLYSFIQCYSGLTQQRRESRAIIENELKSAA